MFMSRIWSILAAICLIAAFVFFWFHNFDGVFVAAVLGVVAWLLDYRREMRKRVFAARAESEES